MTGNGPDRTLPATTVTVGTQIIGTYEVESLINRGGMGEVYRGRNIHNGEAVAIKIVLPSVANDPKYVALFEKEAVVLEKLSHEAIVRYRVFTIDPLLRRPCLIMEFVSGVSLHDRMAEGPMPQSDVRRVLRRVASGLDKAHSMGVVHRDLSPDNVILEDGLVDHAKIIDFGIARSAKFGPATQLEGQFAGKYGYVSPEQMGDFGGNVDGRSDIYSLGLLIAGLSRGSMLPMGSTIFEAVQKRHAVPDLTGVDPDLVPILTHMLRPDPAHRPASMAAVIAMLDNPALIPTGLPEEPEDLQKTVVGQPLPLRPRAAPPPAAAPVAAAGPADGATRVITPPPRPAPAPHPPVAQPAPAKSGGRGGVLVLGAVVLVAAAAGGAWVSGVFGPGTPEAPAVVASAPPPEPAPPPEAVAQQAAAEKARAEQAAAAARLEEETKAAREAAAAEAKAAEDAAAAQAAAEAKAAAETAAAQAAAEAQAATAQAAAEAQAAQDLLARQAAWVAARPPEPCLFVAPLSVPGETALESLAAAPDPVDRLTAAFTAEFGSPPRIAPTTITPAQCAALDFAAQLHATDPAAAGPAPRITLSAADGTVKGGETVRGTIETGMTGAETAGGSVALFSVGPTGAVTDLGEFLQPAGQGRARFAFPTAWAEPPATGGAPVPLLLVAIATDRPVAAFAGLDDGFTAQSVMPHLRYWLQEDGQPGSVALRALTLTP